MAKAKTLKVVKSTDGNQVKKITQEELNQIIEFQNAMGAVNQKIASIEITKMDLLAEFNYLRNGFKEFSNKLEETYGPVEINLSTGEIIEPSESKEQ